MTGPTHFPIALPPATPGETKPAATLTKEQSIPDDFGSALDEALTSPTTQVEPRRTLAKVGERGKRVETSKPPARRKTAGSGTRKTPPANGAAPVAPNCDSNVGGVNEAGDELGHRFAHVDGRANGPGIETTSPER